MQTPGMITRHAISTAASAVFVVPAIFVVAKEKADKGGS